jgi:hypothetical protein
MPSWKPAFPGSFPEEGEVEAVGRMIKNDEVHQIRNEGHSVADQEQCDHVLEVSFPVDVAIFQRIGSRGGWRRLIATLADPVNCDLPVFLQTSV